ncbi:MAG: serine/threonine protein kinase [Gammaproteobacteria bacterium]|nr:serine/threonine protein kinase [Gammaproteobacteria bacterium]
MQALEVIAHNPLTLTPDNDEPQELAIGTVLSGRYMLMGLIACGGTSRIYRARDMLAFPSHHDEQNPLYRSRDILALPSHNDEQNPLYRSRDILALPSHNDEQNPLYRSQNMLTLPSHDNEQSQIYRSRNMLALPSHDDEQNHIALKVVNPSPHEDVSESQMILREVLITRYLAHPNIIKIFDYHRDAQTDFVTMELINGESLADYLVRSPGKKLKYRHAMAILQPVAFALQAAHDQGVIHSDIKPGNILIANDGSIKVIDFANARISMEFVGRNKKLNDDAAFYGYTLAYASPETIADAPARPDDDVFSLACILYEVLSGRHPYDRNVSNAVNTSFRVKKPKEIGLWQWLVIKKALSLESDQRHQSVLQFLRLFRLARWLWACLAILVLVITAGFVTAQLMTQGDSAHPVQAKNVQSVYLQQQEVQTLANIIRQQPELSRLQRLVLLDDFPDLLRFGALEALQDDVVTPVLEHVQHSLNTYENEAQDFSALVQIMDDLLVHYPGSNEIIETRQLVKKERNQRVSSLTEKLRQLWAKTDFFPGTATELNRLTAMLKQFDAAAVVTPDASVIDRYHKNIATALLELDYIRVEQLIVFAEQLVENTEFQWRSDNLPDAISSKIIENHTNQENRSGKSYPGETVEFYYIEPFFAKINQILVDLWLDKAIIATKNQLYAIAAVHKLPRNFPLFKHANDKLVKVVEGKIRHHRNEGNSQAANKMDSLLREIIL